jgi:hypothetical protein
MAALTLNSLNTSSEKLYLASSVKWMSILINTWKKSEVVCDGDRDIIFYGLD